jgi:hypothetical protein
MFRALEHARALRRASDPSPCQSQELATQDRPGRSHGGDADRDGDAIGLAASLASGEPRPGDRSIIADGRIVVAVAAAIEARA